METNPNKVHDQQPGGFVGIDVGSPQLAGRTTQVAKGWDVVAGGIDIWEKSDQFHFVCKRISGDFDIAVRVEAFKPAHLYSKAGLMIRQTQDAGSPHVMFFVFAENAPRNNNLGAYEMQFRAAVGADCQAIYPAAKPPAPPDFPAAYPNSWLRVERKASLFSAFASTDGKSWRLYGVLTLALPPTLYVGPALTSHDPKVAATARFRDFIQAQ